MSNQEKKVLIKIDCGRCGGSFKIADNSVVSLSCPHCSSAALRFSDNVEIGCKACKRNYSVEKGKSIIISHKPLCTDKIFLVRKLKDETV